MALPAYTVRFMGAILAVGGSVNYVVPAGKRAVVRDVTWFGSLAASTLFVQLPGVFILNVLVVPAANRSSDWHGRGVFEAGETIQAVCVGGGGYVTAAGYLLNAV